MEKVKPGDTVRVHYTGRLEDGTVFDSSEGREPLRFTVGEGQVIPGFEQAVIGMEPGESRTAKIPEDQAYGPRRDEMVATVDADQFPEDVAPEVGQQYRIDRGEEDSLIVVVTEVSDEGVTLDGNHPLAGRELVFEITLVEKV